MRLLAYRGQRRAALAQYENCRHLLSHELAVPPDDATILLAEQIRTGKLDTVTWWQGDRVTSVADQSLPLSPCHHITPP